MKLGGSENDKGDYSSQVPPSPENKIKATVISYCNIFCSLTCALTNGIHEAAP